MAESFKRGGGLQALNDDIIKQALKTELEHIKASDTLIGRTLEKCAAEVAGKTESKPFYAKIFSKPSLRYYATAVAACLVVLVILAAYPGIWGKQTAQSKNEMARTQLSDAGNGANPESPQEPAKNKAMQEFTISTAPTNAPEAALKAPAADGRSADGANYATTGIASSDMVASNAYRSLNDNASNQARDNGSSQVAFTALTSAYNQNNGTRYSYDKTRIITVSSVTKGGITTDMLRNAASYHEILGSDSYWILPLNNEQGDVTLLLPVFETAFTDGSEYAYDISFRFAGQTWISSAYMGIPADNAVTLEMLDGKTLEKKVEDTFHAGPVTELIVADISDGRDFIAFLTAGGNEYAIPLFTDNAISTLKNGQAYEIREAFAQLADSLDSAGRH